MLCQVAIIGFALLFLRDANAAQVAQYWNASGAGTSPSGGTGGWNTTSSRWMLATVTPPFYTISIPWTQNNTAIFQGTAGTVTLTENIQTPLIGVLVGGYTFAASGSGILTLIDSGGTARIQVGAGVTTISAPITGSTTAILDGTTGTPPTIILTGTNTWTGGTIVKSNVSVQVGNNGTVGSLPTGSTLIDGSLTLYRSDTVTYTNSFFGSGSIVKKGAGTAIFMGSVTTTNGIDNQQGTVQFGSGGAGVSLGAKVANAGSVVFNHNDLLTLYSVPSLITGTGSFTKRGTGTLQFSGGQLYTGTTTVEAGILRLGDGFSNSGSVVGPIVVNAGATLESAANGTRSMASAVSGSGLFRVTGGQSLTYSGLATHTGGTSILSGSTLTIGNGTGSGFIAGDVIVGGILKLNRTGSVAWGTSITGTGSVELVSSGINTFTGVKSYAGSTTVSSGKLVLSTDLTGGGAITIASGATLTGTGGVTGPAVINGIHEPGGSAGSQSFGSLTYGTTSRLKWELVANTDAPLSTGYDVVSAGAVSISGGALLDVVLNTSGSTVSFLDAFWQQPHQWKVISASSQTGGFSLGAITADSGGRATTVYGLFTIASDGTGSLLSWTPLTPIVSWRLANFGSTGWNDPKVGGNLADPDHDGLPNILEYFFNSSPTVPSTVGLSGLVVNSTGSLEATYIRRKTSDVVVVGEFALSPAGPWASVDVLEEILSDDGTTQHVRISHPVGSDSTGFLRLRVVSP